MVRYAGEAETEKKMRMCLWESAHPLSWGKVQDLARVATSRRTMTQRTARREQQLQVAEGVSGTLTSFFKTGSGKAARGAGGPLSGR